MITPQDVAEGKATQEAFLIESFLMIVDRKLQDVPFELNKAQRNFDQRIAERKSSGLKVKFYHPKSRRRGISAYVAARFLIKCLTQKNIQAGIIAHKDKETVKLFEKVKYYVANLRGAKPTISTDNAHEMKFPDTNSSFCVYTSGSKEVARGLDLNHLHLSEAAFYENPKSLVASLVQTVPMSGEVIVESTGNGMHTWYHRQCLRAYAGTSSYGYSFATWLTEDDCIEILSPEQEDHIRSTYPDLDFDEVELQKQYPNIELGRIAWRREKIDEFDFDIPLFKQEHPTTFHECFKPAESSYFHKVHFMEKHPGWKQLDPETHILDNHPNDKLHYSMGVDVAAGVRKDYSVIEILCTETNEQVFEYRSNKIAPNDFTTKIEDVGKEFGFPLAVIEANNHGHVTLDNLVSNDIYPSDQIFWDESFSTNITKAGHTTNKRTKPLMLGTLRRDLAQGLKIYSKDLMGELSTFTDELKAISNCFDDTVMSLALANKGLYELQDYLPSDAPVKLDTQDPSQFSGIFQRSKETSGQPIASQVEISYEENDPFSFDNRVSTDFYN